MLKNIFAQLLYNDFEIKNIEVFNLSTYDDSEIDYMRCGRTKHLLHLCTNGTRYYETEDLTLTIKPNTLLFIPNGTKYRTHAIKADKENPCRGINICFDCVFPDNESIDFEYGIYSIEDEVNELVKNDFIKINQLWKSSPTSVLKLKSSLYSILCRITSLYENESKDYAVIKPALNFITEHYKENYPVSHYAELCNLSESYFRKKFFEIVGLSPIDYRNELRLNEAKRLYQMNVGLQEIAEKIGFYDACHLSKLYKKHRGTTLKKDTKFI